MLKSKSMAEITGREKVAQIIEDVSAEFGLSLTRVKEDVFSLQNNKVSFCIYSNNWPHNSSSGYRLSWDKEASYKVLSLNKIPSVEQVFIKRTDELPFDKAKAFFVKHDGNVVLKDNFGVNGRSVVFCNNDLADFQSKILNFFSRFGGVNISKKINITNEFRCLVLCGNVELIYKKNRPKIIGDGTSPIIDLLFNSKYKLLKLKSSIENDLYKVPESGEIIEVTDQDNLSLGATPTIIESDDSLFDRLRELSLLSAKVLDLNFCSIDIVLDDNGQLLVLESNAGIMFDNFVSVSQKNEQEVRRIFRKAINILVT